MSFSRLLILSGLTSIFFHYNYNRLHKLLIQVQFQWMTVILSSGLGRNRQDTSLEIGWLHLLPPSITPLSPACPPILISCFFISFLALLLIPLKWARVCFTICLLHRPSPPMRLQVWRNQSYLPLSSTVALQAVFHYFSTALHV